MQTIFLNPFLVEFYCEYRSNKCIFISLPLLYDVGIKSKTSNFHWGSQKQKLLCT